MKYEDLSVGMPVQDGSMIGFVAEIYKRTVHVWWNINGSDKLIYDLNHLQFLSRINTQGANMPSKKTNMKTRMEINTPEDIAAKRGGDNNLPSELTCKVSSGGDLSDDQIRAVFLANGFTVKEGQADIKPYVFAAARAIAALAQQCVVDTQSRAATAATIGDAIPAEGAKGGALNDALMQCCTDLPEGYAIVINAEQGYGGVTWIDPHGNKFDVEGEGHLSDDVIEAYNECVAAAAPTAAKVSA